MREDQIIKDQFKICKYCGELFYRNIFNSDYTWSVRDSCTYKCNSTFLNRKHSRLRAIKAEKHDTEYTIEEYKRDLEIERRGMVPK